MNLPNQHLRHASDCRLMMGLRKSAANFALAFITACCPAANFPPPVEGDFVITNFHFQSGQSLPELRMHYLAFGKPERDKNGVVRNAVLILHGTTGSRSEEHASELQSLRHLVCRL